MTDIMNIGMSGLMAFKAALTVTSNNIANANSPNYSRRHVDFAANVFGNGVEVADVARIFDEQAIQAEQAAISNFSQCDTFLEKMKGFESLFSGNNQIGKLISDSYSALQDLNRNAGSPQFRSTYLTKLTNLSKQFQNLSTTLYTQQQSLNETLQTYEGEMNELLSGIANINQRIAFTTDKDELLDQRDGLLQKLAGFIDFTSSTDDRGMMSVNLTNGAPLVSGDKFYEFTPISDPENNGDFLVGLKGSSSASNITGLIGGGKFAGILEFRKNLHEGMRTIGRLALAFSDTLNQQNKLGVKLDGTFGGNIFADINSTTAKVKRIVTNSNNTGSSSMSMAISDLTQLTTSDYNLQIGAGNSYKITRLVDGVEFTGTISATLPQTINIDGFALTIASGTFNSGDQYTLSPTKDAAIDMKVQFTDAANIALAWPVEADVGTQQQGSSGQITVDAIVNPSSTALATPLQLSPPITVHFLTATTYELIDANDGTTILEGPINYDPNPPANGAIFPTPGAYDPGYTVHLSGTMQAGDTFNIKFNTNRTSDNRNGTVVDNLYKKPILEDKSATFNQGYNLISTNIAIKVQGAKTAFESSELIKDRAEQNRQSVSGVNIEEETMKLAQYQQAYQASAQILQSAKAIFEIIIGMFGR